MHQLLYQLVDLLISFNTSQDPYCHCYIELLGLIDHHVFGDSMHALNEVLKQHIDWYLTAHQHINVKSCQCAEEGNPLTYAAKDFQHETMHGPILPDVTQVQYSLIYTV